MKVKMFLANFNVIKKDQTESLFEEAYKEIQEKLQISEEKAKQLLFVNMVSEFDPDVMDAELKYKEKQFYYKVKINKEDYETWIENTKEEILYLIENDENEIVKNENSENNENKNNTKNKIIELLVEQPDLHKQQQIFFTLEEWIAFKKENNLKGYIDKSKFVTGPIIVKFIVSQDGF